MTHKLQIVALEDCHLPQAVELFLENYRDARLHHPVLPERYLDAQNVLPLLKWITGKYYGVAALDGENVVGYLTGIVIPEFHSSHTGAYTPEWGHAASAERRQKIYAELFHAISPKWLADGCLGHAVTILSTEEDSRDFWYWYGYGMYVIDVMRDLEAPLADAPEVQVRPAVDSDIRQLLPLALEHHHYMLSAPVLLFDDEELNEQTIRGWLTEPGRVVWVAERDEEILGYMHVVQGGKDACMLVRDERVLSLQSTHVAEKARGAGVGKALLTQVNNWAKTNGYRSLSVDFEAANIQARNFWLRYFEPVCYSVMRRMDDRFIQK